METNRRHRDDISMPGMNGLVATRTLKNLRPPRHRDADKHTDDAYLQELLRAGLGYVLKQSAPAELLLAIREAARPPAPGPTLAAKVTADFLQKQSTPVTTLLRAIRNVSRRCCVSSLRLQQQGNRHVWR